MSTTKQIPDEVAKYYEVAAQHSLNLKCIVLGPFSEDCHHFSRWRQMSAIEKAKEIFANIGIYDDDAGIPEEQQPLVWDFILAKQTPEQRAEKEQIFAITTPEEQILLKRWYCGEAAGNL